MSKETIKVNNGNSSETRKPRRWLRFSLLSFLLLGMTGCNIIALDDPSKSKIELLAIRINNIEKSLSDLTKGGSSTDSAKARVYQWTDNVDEGVTIQLIFDKALPQEFANHFTNYVSLSDAKSEVPFTGSVNSNVYTLSATLSGDSRFTLTIEGFTDVEVGAIKYSFAGDLRIPFNTGAAGPNTILSVSNNGVSVPMGDDNTFHIKDYLALDYSRVSVTLTVSRGARLSENNNNKPLSSGNRDFTTDLDFSPTPTPIYIYQVTGKRATSVYRITVDKATAVYITNITIGGVSRSNTNTGEKIEFTEEVGTDLSPIELVFNGPLPPPTHFIVLKQGGVIDAKVATTDSTVSTVVLTPTGITQFSYGQTYAVFVKEFFHSLDNQDYVLKKPLNIYFTIINE